MSTENDKVVHIYDDIREEDNHLPNWWLAILFGSILFGFGYWFVYHTTEKLPTPTAEYRAEVEQLKKKRLEANPTSDEAITALVSDAAALDDGHQVFTSTCAACHGQQGEGLVGPNLTDKYWIHGAKGADVYKAVDQGFADKGMPAWGPVLGADKARKVAAFVLSLKGKNLAGKEPQGEPIE
jgi:cytochrome c oxidase cbb3-type subunit III